MIKKFCTKAGNLVAVLFMFGPVVIVSQYERFNNKITFIFWIIISVLYDFYMYSVIENDNYIEDTRNWFFNVFNERLPKTKTIEEKRFWYETICINMFMDHFKDDRNK